MTSSDEFCFRGLALDALEASRVEVVRRLQAVGLPTTTAVNRLLVTDDSGEGSQSGMQARWVSISASPLHVDKVARAIRDQDEAEDRVPLAMLGFRRQLMPLAQALVADGRIAGGSNMELPVGVDWAITPESIISRHLAGFACAYLEGLADLKYGEPDLASRLVDELETFVAAATVSRIDQMILDGIRVEVPMSHRAVTLRPLTPLERGRYWELNGPQSGSHAFVDEIVQPTTWAISVPATLLEVTTDRAWNTFSGQGSLMNRVALGLLLLGYPLSGTGTTVSFDNPRWAWFGVGHHPSLLRAKMVPEQAVVSAEDLRVAIELAYQMPDFETETSHKQIALRRLLRGLGAPWTESGFLDYAIALEAALLPGMASELRYRFSLYGSLFLREIRDPSTTFRDLKLIYNIRSSLVHGSKPDPASVAAATTSAAEITRLVVRRAVTSGWPDPTLLDREAIGRSDASEH